MSTDECQHATYLSTVPIDDHGLTRNLVQCNATLNASCGFAFVFKDEDGEEVDWRDGWAVLSTELAEWDATHHAWSRMTADERTAYEADAKLERA